MLYFVKNGLGGVRTYKFNLYETIKKSIHLCDDFRSSKIVHLHTPHEALLYFWKVLFYFRKKVIYTPHSYPTYFYKKIDLISTLKYSAFEIFIYIFHFVFLIRCKKCICLTQYEYRIWSRYFPFLSYKFITVPTAIMPIQEPREVLPRNLILWIGSFDDRKQPHKFLDFVRMYNSLFDKTDLGFVMCGDGPLFDDICRIANDNTIFFNLEIKKNVAHADILKLFNRAKYLVSFSVQEGLPMTFLEALENGARIITTIYRGGDVYEFLDQSNSIILKSSDYIRETLSSINLDFVGDTSHLSQPYNFEIFIESHLCIYEN